MPERKNQTTVEQIETISTEIKLEDNQKIPEPPIPPEDLKVRYISESATESDAEIES